MLTTPVRQTNANYLRGAPTPRSGRTRCAPSTRDHFAVGAAAPPVVGMGALADGAAGSVFGLGTVDRRSHAPSTLMAIAASATVAFRPI